MIINFLTYNTLFNRGLNGLREIIKKEKLDIICLQEIKTFEDNLYQTETDFLKLADFSHYIIKNNNTFGLATFYNFKKFKFLNSKIIRLKKTFLDFILSLPNLFKSINTNRNFLKTQFFIKSLKKKITIYNVHLSVYASNKTKRKQLKLILNEYKKNKNDGVIIAGDFNYLPYNRKELEKIMESFGFKEATKKINYTIRYRNLKQFYYNLITRFFTKIFIKIFTDRLKIDYVFYKNLKIIKALRIDIDYSDHYPILIKFKV